MTIKIIVNIILVYDDNNNFVNQFFEYILLITMLTIKILFTINSLKKKLFRQNTIYNSFRLKKHLVLIRKKIHFIEQKLFKLRTFPFNLNNSFRIKK